jgi:transposase
VISPNVIFFFQPPYYPEVNPMERFWQFLKDGLGGEFFDSSVQLKEEVGNILKSVSTDAVRSLI